MTALLSSFLRGHGGKMSSLPTTYILLAFENYYFHYTDGVTELRVEQDIAPEYEQYMQDTWPLALQKLKALCERNE